MVQEKLSYDEKQSKKKRKKNRKSRVATPDDTSSSSSSSTSSSESSQERQPKTKRKRHSNSNSASKKTRSDEIEGKAERKDAPEGKTGQISKKKKVKIADRSFKSEEKISKFNDKGESRGSLQQPSAPQTPSEKVGTASNGDSSLISTTLSSTEPVPRPSPPSDAPMDSHESYTVPAQTSSEVQSSLESDFETWYLKTLTQQYGDDLDKIRNAPDFKDSSVAILIKALKQGTSLFTAEEKKAVVGSKRT